MELRICLFIFAAVDSEVVHVASLVSRYETACPHEKL